MSLPRFPGDAAPGVPNLGHPLVLDTIAKAGAHLTEMCHGASRASGWWEAVDTANPFFVPAKLCLVHSEISEAMEGARKNLMDDKLAARAAADGKKF